MTTNWDIEEITRQQPDQITTDDGITIRIQWHREYFWPNAYQANVDNVDTGICAEVTNAPFGRDPFVEVDYARHVRATWDRRPVAVVGIMDLDAALDDLVDTGRAYRAYATNAKARAARTRELLHAAAERRTVACTEPPAGPARWVAMQDANRERETLVVRALADALLTAEEIATLAGLDLSQVEQLAQYAEPTPPTYYLSLEGFARRIGVTTSTIKSYRSRGQLPEPDITLGGSPGWSLDTADAYQRDRRGQGHRSDLAEV